MRILITGGCGYTGTLLTNDLIDLGYKVTVVDTQWFGNHLQPKPRLKIIKLDIRKNADIDIGGNVDMDVVGNIVVDATGDESIIDINTIGDSSQIDINTAGLLKVMSTGTTNIESTADMTLKSTTINLDGNVAVTGNIVTQGTTTTDGDLVLDTHTHTISGGSSAGNTSAPN